MNTGFIKGEMISKIVKGDVWEINIIKEIIIVGLSEYQQKSLLLNQKKQVMNRTIEFESNFSVLCFLSISAVKILLVEYL